MISCLEDKHTKKITKGLRQYGTEGGLQVLCN